MNNTGRFPDNILDCVLEDDSTQTGGTSFAGETVRDFLLSVSPEENICTLDELNEALSVCGIKPISNQSRDGFSL